MESNNLVFVYDTLQKGYEDHQILYDAVSLGKGKTVSDEFILRALEGSGAPYVSDMKSDIHSAARIHGEVYEVSSHEVTDIETHIELRIGSCIRRLVEIDIKGNGTVYAWMYMNNNLTDGYVIYSGNYSTYKRPGEI